jgi:hypothetical protein
MITRNGILAVKYNISGRKGHDCNVKLIGLLAGRL